MKRGRHPQAPQGGVLASDWLRGLRQEQRCLIDSWQWVSLAANTFPLAL
jgi:hypothetical protein